eukprot:c18049_g1_i1.p1 GENE.c18049_g1_i1~~c18049_g1_i1.p1  ORF type:complete len:521 (+),score=133.10 c18049_g1_i1:26-1564(+)
MTEVEVEAQDVIRLMLQFCKENGLQQTFNALQAETQTTLNTVDSVEQFIADITNGHWDSVLHQVSTLKLPPNKVIDLYEQICRELIEIREIETARSVLRQTEAMQSLKLSDPGRYMKLEHLLARTYFEPKEAYPPGVTKEKHRIQIAQDLAAEVSVAPPSRLLALLGQALKWQQYQGMLPPGSAFDVFRGTAPSQASESETHPTILERTIKFDSESHPECCRFSADGLNLAIGSVDGFIELWDPSTAKLRKDLEYQAKDKFMMHEASVLCLNFSRDSDVLVSGAQDGKVKVWSVRSGQCLRRFEHAHSQGVTSAVFSKDGTHVLTGSFDTTVKIHGLKSGKMLKEFRGHTSYVNDVSYSVDGSRVISASSDGSVRLWDSKTTECVRVIIPPHTSEAAVLHARAHPRNQDHLVICNRSSTLYVMTATGDLIKQYTTGKREGGDFVACCISPRGKWFYCLGEDACLYCFSVETGKLEHVITKVHEREAIGIVHHPHRNTIATFSGEGHIKFWRP